MKATRLLGLGGGVIVHGLLAVLWSWSGGWVFAAVMAVHLVILAPASMWLWPERVARQFALDGVMVTVGAILAGTPSLALPWLLILFLAPMGFAGTRPALWVLGTSVLLTVPAVVFTEVLGVGLVDPLSTGLHVAYMFVGFFGDALVAGIVSLAVGASVKRHTAELAAATEATEQQRSHLEALFDTIPTPVAEFDMSEAVGRFGALEGRGVADLGHEFVTTPTLAMSLVGMTVAVRVNPGWATLFGGDRGRLLGRVDCNRIPVSIRAVFERVLSELYRGRTSGDFQQSFDSLVGKATHGWYGYHVVGAPEFPNYARVIVTVVDETEREELIQTLNDRNEELAGAFDELRAAQTEMLAGQKMEAIGVLAAGIAHEINTPIQYVGDNIRFFGEASGDVLSVLQTAAQAATEYEAGALRPETVEMMSKALEAADVEFLLEELPVSVRQALEGIERVAVIVRAMKDFAHPGEEDLAPIDLNAAIETTVTVSRNEWKYVADLEADLDSAVGMVPALSGPLNQVILNLIVNAAHAITDKGDSERGRIGITTRRQDDYAVISISDNGCGIPEEIRDRVFEPFFTTKEVGRGSGQGLAIAQRVISERHGGTLEVESEVGVGTTFIIRIPLRVERAA